jgi:hypothetical protein
MTKIFDTIMGDPYPEFCTYICIGYAISGAICWWAGLDEIHYARDIILWVSLVTVVFPRLGERK